MSDLVTVRIDDVEISVPKGMLVVDAAKKIGNDIPVFCYHPKMTPVGMCRMCLVEIGLPVRDRTSGELQTNPDGTPQINFGRTLQTGCTVVVSEGMVVRTATQPALDAREDVLEFLLSSHPLDCPICDKGGECPLQNLTIAHGPGASRMDYTLKLKLAKHVPLGDLIYLDRERCIQCARCIRFQEEIVDDPVLAFHNRGRHLEIVTMSEPGFDSIWSGNTTDICPVGALTTSDFRFAARPWELIPVASISIHSPAGANLTFSTRREARRDGRAVIKRVMPRQNEAVNEIWIHDRDRFVHHFADAPDRLAKPLLRRGGELVEAGWDEVIEFVAERLQKMGDKAAGLSGDRLSNEDLFLFQKLLRQGVQTPHIDLGNRTLAGGEVTAQVGISRGSNLGELGPGDAIMVIASDLHEEEPIWWLRVKQAAQRGATLVTLNARATRLDKFATHVIRYKPGQAVPTLRQLVNATKVDVQTTNQDPVKNAADAIINAHNLVAFYGAEGVTLAETQALARLLGNLLLLKAETEAGAVAGHAGRHNNGLIAVWPHNNTQGAWDMGIHPAFGAGYMPLDNAGKDAAAIYEGVQDGAIRALYVAGTDPVGDGLLADRGQLELLVVQELFLTETAKLADVVLPAQSWAERDGTFTSGERRVQRYYPAIPPLGQSREDWRIFAQLCEKMGLGKAPLAASLVFREVATAVPQYNGLDYRTLARVEEQWPIIGREDLYYGGTSYDNKSGLGQQWPAAAESGAIELFDIPDGVAVEAEGLRLIRAAALYTPGTLINHSLEILAERLAWPALYLHETDAAPLAVADGQEVKVRVNGRDIPVTVRVNGLAAAGTAVINGVPYLPGAMEFEVIGTQ